MGTIPAIGQSGPPIRYGAASALCLCWALIGCGSSADDVLDKWLGPQIHFELRGQLAGEEVAISLSESDVDPTTLFVRRTWGVPDKSDLASYSQGVFLEAEVRVRHPAIQTFMEGLTQLEIELKGEKELIDAPPGTQIALVPRAGADIYNEFLTAGSMWLEVELKDQNDVKFYQKAAQRGTFTLHENSGTVSSDGLTYERHTGRMSGYFQARWSVTDELSGSFTVPGTSIEIESYGQL